MAQQSKKRVLMLVNNHVYSDPRVLSEAESLMEAGYTVSIIGAARQPGYPTNAFKDDISIVLTPTFAGFNLLHVFGLLWQLIRGRIENHETSQEFYRSGILSLIFFNLWIIRLGISYSVNVLHCHDFSPLPATWVLSKLKRTKMIYDSHESAPALRKGIMKSMVTQVESLIMKQVDEVITVGERLATNLRNRGARKVTVVGNWKKLEDYSFSQSEVSDKHKQLELGTYKLIVTYIGTLQPTRLFAPLFEIIPQTPEVAYIFGGWGDFQTQIEELAMQHDNVKWLGPVDFNDIPLYTAISDIIYYCLSPATANSYFSTPNKLFEAFAAGKALIVHKGIGEISEILERYNAGILLDTVTPDNLIETLNNLQNPDTLQKLQNNAKRASIQYNWAVAETRLLEIYDNLLGKS